MINSDYYLIGGVILYLIFIGCCAYSCSNYEDKWPTCLQCLSKEKDEYTLINA